MMRRRQHPVSPRTTMSTPPRHQATADAIKYQSRYDSWAVLSAITPLHNKLFTTGRATFN
jgi:hypothetical protein